MADDDEKLLPFGEASPGATGLELLLDTREVCRRRGGHFHLAALNPLCHDILQTVGIAGLFEIHRDSVSAAGSFAQ